MDDGADGVGGGPPCVSEEVVVGVVSQILKKGLYLLSRRQRFVSLCGMLQKMADSLLQVVDDRQGDTMLLTAGRLIDGLIKGPLLEVSCSSRLWKELIGNGHLHLFIRRDTEIHFWILTSVSL